MIPIFISIFVFGSCLLFTFYMLYRTRWVYDIHMRLSDRRRYLLANPPSPLTNESAEKRLLLLDQSFDILWDYNKMMFHFWNWNPKTMMYRPDLYDKLMEE